MTYSNYFVQLLIVMLPFCFEGKSESVKAIEPLDFVLPSQTKLEEDFNVFWSKFRMAVIQNDTSQINDYVEFPLAVYGNEDEDPILEINKKQFSEIFGLYLKRERFNGELKSETNLNYIKRNATVPKNEYSLQGKSQRLSDMGFHKSKDSKWRLVEIYLDTRSLMENNPSYRKYKVLKH